MLGWFSIGWMCSVTRSAQADVSTVAKMRMTRDLHRDQWTTAPCWPVTAQTIKETLAFDNCSLSCGGIMQAVRLDVKAGRLTGMKRMHPSSVPVETETSSGAKRRMTQNVRAFILKTGIVKTRIQERKQAREWMTTRRGYASSSHTGTHVHWSYRSHNLWLRTGLGHIHDISPYEQTNKQGQI
ncbi:hypothetical protein EYF80_018841 [Liparis tanakae]|uniref:Secreted protein n=1 Tax=Liparis tanakae TaxID=230148 RepID=A0A4Z2HYC9_9TELE|nr:hypothetical protein EYF80_018841 [Liparis tanakae]